MLGVVVLAATAGGIWIWSSSRPSRSAAKLPSATAGMQGMPGMADMPGMNMGGDGSVQLSSDQVRQFGITFGTVDERTLTANLRTTGTVTAAETGVVRVTPKVSGYAERLYVNFTGASVRRGQPLLEFYSPEILAAQEDLLLARRADRVVGDNSIPGMPAASNDLQASARRRLRLLDVSDAQITEVLRSGRAQRTVTIVAPASGVVTEKMVVVGQAVSAGTSLYTITDLSRIWVEVEVREADVGAIRTGLGADVELAALPGRQFKGRVEFIQPIVDSATRTVRARVGVTNTAMALKPGMYATVTLTIPSRRALTVPAGAVINTGERSVVFVDMGRGRLMPHDVEISRAAGEYIEILSGLEPGQRVVTSAQFLLESESNIGEVMRAMMGQTGSADMKMDMPATVTPAAPPLPGRR